MTCGFSARENEAALKIAQLRFNSAREEKVTGLVFGGFSTQEEEK